MVSLKKVFSGGSSNSADEPMYMGKNLDDDAGVASRSPRTSATTGSATTASPRHSLDTAATSPSNSVSGAATSHGTGTATTGGSGLTSGSHDIDDIPRHNARDQLPVQEGVTGRHEETGAPLRAAGASTGSAFTNPHGVGHGTKDILAVDPERATHDHKHLAPVVHENVRHVEVEEVLRQKEHERHAHHVQHHVQPVLDKQVKEEVHHDKVHPVTKIHEKHTNTDKDHASFAALNVHKHETKHAPVERQVVDLGEQVNETVHHHVHHVTQPVIEREVHDRHRIHTVIPSHHVTHEAPIVHASSTHAPMHISDFLNKGGKIDSNLTHDNVNLLNDGECERSVDGVGEKLARELNLKSGTTAQEHQGTTRI